VVTFVFWDSMVPDSLRSSHFRAKMPGPHIITGDRINESFAKPSAQLQHRHLWAAKPGRWTALSWSHRVPVRNDFLAHAPQQCDVQMSAYGAREMYWWL
jgi:hypothetical protein